MKKPRNYTAKTVGMDEFLKTLDSGNAFELFYNLNPGLFRGTNPFLGIGGSWQGSILTKENNLLTYYTNNLSSQGLFPDFISMIKTSLQNRPSVLAIPGVLSLQGDDLIKVYGTNMSVKKEFARAEQAWIDQVVSFTDPQVGYIQGTTPLILSAREGTVQTYYSLRSGKNAVEFAKLLGLRALPGFSAPESFEHIDQYTL
jgi:hypothetical protein